MGDGSGGESGGEGSGSEDADEGCQLDV